MIVESNMIYPRLEISSNNPPLVHNIINLWIESVCKIFFIAKPSNKRHSHVFLCFFLGFLDLQNVL